MRSRRRTRFVARTRLATVAALGLALGACNGNRNAYVPPPAAKVGVAQPLRRDVTRYLQLTGTTQVVRSVDLVARVQGYLRAISYKDGAQVHAGDQLFLIEQDQYKAALAQAQASVDGAKASLVNAQAQFARQQQLGTKDFTSKADVDTARAAMDTAQAQLEQSQASVRVAELNLGYTSIKAPFDGVVSAHQADVGALVGYGTPTVLATIVQVDPIYVVFNVSEPDVLRFKQQLAARKISSSDLGPISVDVGTQVESGYPHHGTLDYAAPQGNAGTGTLDVRAIFTNKDLTLLAGIFVRVRIPVEQLKNAMLLPARAIGFDQQGSYVLIVNKDNVVEERHIVTQAREDGTQIVESGLAPDARVIIDGLQRATLGSVVTPRDVKIDAAAQAEDSENRVSAQIPAAKN
jgi:membrane fusion protein, multidrug efflux system